MARSAHDIADLADKPKIEPHCEPIQRNKAGQFLQGSTGNRGGRPAGSRNKVAETFLADLHEVWQLHGREALIACAQTDPARFCAITAATLPKDFQISAEVTVQAAMSNLQ